MQLKLSVILTGFPMQIPIITSPGEKPTQGLAIISHSLQLEKKKINYLFHKFWSFFAAQKKKSKQETKILKLQTR